MPIVRKVFEIGDSKAITLPKSWLKYYEEKAQHEIREVEIEVNRELKIRPIIKGGENLE